MSKLKQKIKKEESMLQNTRQTKKLIKFLKQHLNNPSRELAEIARLLVFYMETGNQDVVVDAIKLLPRQAAAWSDGLLPDEEEL